MLKTSTVLFRWHIAIKEYVPRREGSCPFHHRQEYDPRAIDPQRSALRDTKKLVILLGGTVQGIGSPTVTPNVRMPMAATTRSTERYEYVHSMATLSLVMPVSSR